MSKAKALTAKQLCKKIENLAVIFPNELADHIRTMMDRDNASELTMGFSPYAGYARDVYRVDRGNTILLYDMSVELIAGDKRVRYQEKDFDVVIELYNKTIKILAKAGFKADIVFVTKTYGYAEPKYQEKVEVTMRRFLFWKYKAKETRRMEKYAEGFELTFPLPTLVTKACCGKE